MYAYIISTRARAWKKLHYFKSALFTIKIEPTPSLRAFPSRKKLDACGSSLFLFLYFSLLVGWEVGARTSSIVLYLCHLLGDEKQQCPLAAYWLCATRLGYANNRYTPQLWCLALPLLRALRVVF